MKKDRRVRKTDQAVFEALQRLTETTPLSQITMTSLAKEADITRKTLYGHFPTVTDAYQALMSETVERLRAKTEDDWEALGVATLKLDAASQAETRLFLFLGNVRETIQPQWERSVKRRRFVSQEELYGHLLGPMIDAIRSGLIGEPDLFKGREELVASFVLAGTLWAYRRWMENPSEESLSSVQSSVCSLLMHGLDAMHASA